MKLSNFQMREQLKNAGVEIDYCQNRIKTHKAGVAMSFPQTFHSESRERAILNRIATAYSVDMPAQA